MNKRDFPSCRTSALQSIANSATVPNNANTMILGAQYQHCKMPHSNILSVMSTALAVLTVLRMLALQRLLALSLLRMLALLTPIALAVLTSLIQLTLMTV